MEPEEIKHLELIQAVVTRLAGNSFSIKGWTITLVAALMALSAKDANPRYAAIAALPVIFFWGLDAYYLRQERLFRRLYDIVRRKARVRTNPAEQFAAPELFMMNTNVEMEHEPKKVSSWFGTAISRTILGFHLPILLVVLVITVYAAYFVSAGKPAGEPAVRVETPANRSTPDPRSNPNH